MKSSFLLLLASLAIHAASAQLTITAGAQFSIFSDTKLTLHNTDLINDGDFLEATTSPISFTGDASSFIGGDQVVRFFKMEINKTGNHSVSLRKTISVGSSILFTAGFFDLNGFNVDLETTGQIIGENNNARFVGANGGEVFVQTTLNAPSNVNPGNLGIQISSDQNPGQVIIKRGHKSQSTGSASGSILRYYEILPANSSNLNATLRINYFDGELNGQNENSLVMFKSEDGVNWSAIGFTSRDLSANFIETTGISSFSRLTLSAIDNPLAVQFIAFNVSCLDNKVAINWKTAQEENSSHFNVERSKDGARWSVIGNVPASGNSGVEKSYSFSDDNPVGNAFYRIAEYDLSGRAIYTAILRSSCDISDALTVWPNPVSDKIYLNIVAQEASEAMIKLFDSKGALVRIQRSRVFLGSNQISVDVNSLSRGVYQLSVYFGNRVIGRTMPVLKQ